MEIIFKRCSKTLFKDIKEIINDRINEFKGVKGVYLQMFYKIDDEMKYRNYSLNNEKWFNDVINILNAKPFELTENLIEGGYMEQETFISISDDARVNNFNLPISCISGFRLCNKKNLTTSDNEIIKVCADNGGSFYPYKINKQFENNEFINNILKHYQITNDLKNEMFNVNF